MTKLIKEPLVHFLLIGLVIFLVYGLTARTGDSRDEIIISDSDLDHMVGLFRLQWQRNPTEEELIALVSKSIRQEILYREALKMNLDHNDEVVKRRLAQKMDFLSNDVSALVNDPNDEELRRYFEKHADKYMEAFRFSFYQIVFRPENYEDPVQMAEKVLDSLENASVEEMIAAGDVLSLRNYFENVEATRLDIDLGSGFSRQLEPLPLNKWTGPVKGGYGVHLVYITERNDPALPEFGQIRDLLVRDYVYDKEQESKDIIYEQLSKEYDIELQVSLEPALSARILDKVRS